MLEFNLNSTESISFVLDIAGESAPPRAKLVIPVSENYSICFDAIIEEKKATVIIPALEGVIPGGIKEGARLEVIVPHNDEDNSSSFFTPWEGDILFKSPVSVKAKVEMKKPTVVAEPIKNAIVIDEEKSIKKPEEGEIIKTDESDKPDDSIEPGEIKPMFEFTGFQSRFLRSKYKDTVSGKDTNETVEDDNPQKQKLKRMMKQL